MMDKNFAMITKLMKYPESRTCMLAAGAALGVCALYKIMNIKIKIVDDPVDVEALKARNADRMQRWKELSPKHYNQIVAFQKRLENEPGLAEQVMASAEKAMDLLENDVDIFNDPITI